ncbi:cytochrome P450 pisatin demethylase [Penicillium brevicompactum]|uniref:Cytochrome P450 pisatin demethylase n=1 Tax=Penicillium brevicompactum TaxID=5074 RepID=A0A9W9R949_PENBR|nr:cytochrome P450 pisatin demethylase [Penicillium brevicompactum]
MDSEKFTRWFDGISPSFLIPGPILARFTNVWYLWQMKRGDFHHTNIRLHQENGSIVRIAPNYYSISDPSAIKTIYGHGSKFEKSEWYDAWNFGPTSGFTNLFSERSSKKHAEDRRKVASMYSMTSLVSYEPLVDNCIEIFKKRLHEISTYGRSIDMAHWMQCYAFDVIGEITFGSRFGFLEAGNDIGGVMESIDSGLTVSSYLGLYSWIYPSYLWISRKLGLGQTYATQFTFQHIQETKATMKNHSADLPSHMAMKLVQKQTQNPHDLSDWDVLSTAGSNVGAGSDTTAISLSSTLYYLLRNPECLARLRKEIEDSGVGSSPTFKETQAMPYLQAVFKEAFRVHPGTGYPLFRTVPKGGEVIAGQFFPEGVNVGVNSWVSHYDKDIFGQDADIFRPERWLESNKEQLIAMEQNYMPFGAGSRTCIGKNISLLEMGKLMPILVRDFDFVLSRKIEQESWATRARWFVKPQDFEVGVRRRV